MIIKALFLAALVKLLLSTDKPLLCSTLYAFLILALGTLSVVAGQATGLQLLIATTLAFFVSSLFFILLSKTEGGTWWLVLVLGVAVLVWA